MASEAPVSMDNRITMVLLSKTGHGKSSLANALLQTKEFAVNNRMTSTTSVCKCMLGMAKGRHVTVVDTPGAMDVTNPDKALREICAAITYCPMGFDAFLLVIKCDTKFTVEERAVFDLLEKMFGEHIFKHSIIVFSRGDEYDNDEAAYADELQQTRSEIKFLSELLDKCGNRWVLMDNGRKCDTEIQAQQVEKLLKLIESMMKTNQSRYTNEYIQLAQERTRQAEERRKEEEEEFKKAEERRRQEEINAKVAEARENMRKENDRIAQEFKEEQRRKAEEDRKRIVEELAKNVKADGKSCFPAEATVQTPDGPVSMQQLSVGQSVLCMQDNKLIYSPVYMWGHRDVSSCSNSYVTVRTESTQLTLSSDHLLLLLDETGQQVSVPAGDVRAGQTVHVLDNGVSDRLNCEQVLTVQRCVLRKGLFAPFTLCGNIIVDGMLASCYVSCVSPALSHALLWPVRVAWQLRPSAVEACNQLGGDGMPWWVSVIVNRLLPRLPWLAVGGDKKIRD